MIRYMMHFTILETVIFFTGFIGSFLFVSTCQVLSVEFSADEETDKIFYLGLNLVVYTISVVLNRLYIKRYIKKKDDLVGDMDTLKVIVKQKRNVVSLKIIFEVLKFESIPLLVATLNFAINSPFQWMFTPEKPLFGDISNSSLYILISTGASILGGFLCLLVPLFTQYLLVLLLLIRLAIMAIVSMLEVHDYTNSSIIYSTAFFITVPFIWSFLFGCITVQLPTICTSLVPEIRKSQAGYLLACFIIVGNIYGLILVILTCKTSTE